MRKSRHIRVKVDFLIRLDEAVEGLPQGLDPSKPIEVFVAAVRAMAPKIDCYIEPGGRLSVSTAYPMPHRQRRR